MLFSSAEFFYFFIGTTLVYWCLPKQILRQILLILASCFFYGQFSKPFLALLVFTLTLDFHMSQILGKPGLSKKRRRFYLGLSLFSNFFPLLFFKLAPLVWPQLIEPSEHLAFLKNITLPLGMSFYTFQSVSYMLDVYRKRIKPCSNYLHYFLYVAFFPALLSGPISRFEVFQKNFKRAKWNWPNLWDGSTLIIWGLSKKIIVADTIHLQLQAFWEMQSNNNLELTLGLSLLVLMSVSIQLYCDFSGYSDIARGCAQVLGMHLPKNFYFPLFASNMAELWRRQHITMSNWFRDYVFYPLNFKLKRWGLIAVMLSTTVTFLLSGLWHGFTWGCIIFGLLQAAVIILEKIKDQISYRLPQFTFMTINSPVAGILQFAKISLGAILTSFIFASSILFLLSPSYQQAWNILKAIYQGIKTNSSLFPLIQTGNLLPSLFEPNILALVTLSFFGLHFMHYGVRQNLLHMLAKSDGIWFRGLSIFYQGTQAIFMAFSLCAVLVLSTEIIPFIYYQF